MAYGLIALKTAPYFIVLLSCVQFIEAMDDLGLYINIRTLGNETARMKCDEINLDKVQELYVTKQRGVECACQIQSLDQSKHVPVILESGSRKIKLSERIWQSTHTIALTVRSYKLTLMSCDMTYEQQAPVIINIRGDGARVKCSSVIEDVIVDGTCAIPTSHQQETTPHDKILEMHLGLIVIAGCVATVIINIVSIILLKRCAGRKDKTDIIRDHYVLRRQPAFRRQQTNQSHPYESILVEPWEEMDVETQLESLHEETTQNQRPNPPDYLPMTGSSRNRLMFEDGREIETDLDAFVYPPSTHYGEHVSPKTHSRSPGYSYAYSSAENVSVQGWPRKFSIESLDSAAAMQIRHSRLKQLAQFSERDASFDSGYAERIPPTNANNCDFPPGVIKLRDSEQEHTDESVYVETDSVSGMTSGTLDEACSNQTDGTEVADNDDCVNKAPHKQLSVFSHKQMDKPPAAQTHGYLSLF